ncbi:hypothetical protein RFI_14769, partial [Reticulomyxa filosa]
MTTPNEKPNESENVPVPNKKLHRVESVLKFGDQYKAAQILQFSDYYIDYESLKSLLHDQFTSEAHVNQSLRKKRLTFLQALLKEVNFDDLFVVVDNFHGERLRKYNEQHKKKLLPAEYNEWKANQLEKQKAYLQSKEQERSQQAKLDEEQHKTNNSEDTTQTQKKKRTTTQSTAETTSQQEIDGEAFSNLDLEDALMAIDENEATDQKDKEKKGSSEAVTGKLITSKDVTMAIRALSRLLLFWKQNELAIFNI